MVKDVRYGMTGKSWKEGVDPESWEAACTRARDTLLHPTENESKTLNAGFKLFNQVVAVGLVCPPNFNKTVCGKNVPFGGEVGLLVVVPKLFLSRWGLP